MIASTFATGQSNGGSPVGYLLSSENRSEPPEVLEGDPDATIEIIDSIDRQYKYTSGVLAFRNAENPTKDQLHRIISKFRDVMLPGLTTENFNDLWVLHRDKGNIELHFIVPMEELTTGKALNIHPPGQRNQEHWKNFSAYINNNYGWGQVVANPLKAQLSAFDLSPNEKGQASKSIKTNLMTKLQKGMLNGKINNRDDLINALQKIGIEVPRHGNDYISVKLPGSAKAMRLKGEIFNKNADYKKLVSAYQDMPNKQFLSKEQALEVKLTLAQNILERKEFNVAKYLTPKTDFSRKPKPTPIKNIINMRKKIMQNTDQNSTKPITEIKVTKTKPVQPTAKSKAMDKIRKLRNSTFPKTSSFSGSGINSAASILDQMGSLSGQLSSLESQITNETDHSKRSELVASAYRIRQQLSALKADLIAAQAKDYAENKGLKK